MAASPVGKARLSFPLVLVLFTSFGFGQVQIEQVATSLRDVPNEAISQLLIQSALNSLNEQSPSQNAYKNSQLIEAQKLVKSPYVIYKLKLKLEPVCQDASIERKKSECSLEICSLDVEQHEQGVIKVLTDSVKCDLLKNDETSEIMEEVEKQIVKQPGKSFDREVQLQNEEENDRAFVAVRASQSEYCPGCPYELNPSLPGLSAFGEQALRSMDESSFGDFRHKLISIVRVSRAVPPNANIVRYQLLMEIAESNCLKTSLIQLSECSLQTNLPVKLCLVTFEERPWHAATRTITKNNCTELLNTADNEVSANVQLTNSKPPQNSIPLPSSSSSSSSETPKTSEFFDQIAQEAQETPQHLSDKHFRKNNVEDVSTRADISEPTLSTTTPTSQQYAANDPSAPPRFVDKLREFDEFLEDFDVPIKYESTTMNNLKEPVKEQLIQKETIACNNPTEEGTIVASEQAAALFKDRSDTVLSPTVESIRAKRDLSKKSLYNNKAIVRKLTLKAVEMLDQLDDDNKKKHVLDIIDFQTEWHDHSVVYYVTVEVAPTDCSEQDKSTECLDEVIPGPTQICKLSIASNEKKPLQTPKLLHYDCKYKQKYGNRSKRENKNLGAPQPHNSDDPQIKKFIQLGLQQYSENFEGTNKPMISKVRNVSVQVVSGLLYKIETDIGVSTCKKGENVNCQLKADEAITQCTIEAWSQPWMDKGNAKIKIRCDQDKRWKRSLRGVNYSERMMEQSRQLKEEKLFHAFVAKYNRIYESEEEKKKRFNIFRENLDMIEELQRNEQGTARYGVTQFTDLTKAEFKANYLGLKPLLKSENDIPMPMANIPDIQLPDEYDWRQYNVVTAVKNQGSCGSCWAFSVTGNVEGQYAIKHGELLSLSEQELVDCDKLDDGCNGGLPDTAYRAIETLGGLETESDYPYDAEDEQCHFNKSKVKVTVVSGLNITSNETQMAQWLVKNGPMSIGINANAMQFYMGGVSHPFKFLCNPDDLDHGVLIVGYGVRSYPIFKKKMPYWLIKNSWGPHWGEQGYYRVYRGDGTCGVNKMVTSAVVA